MPAASHTGQETTALGRLPGTPFRNPFENPGGPLTRLKNRTGPPRLPLPLQPETFTGAPSQDVRSWLHSLDIVLLAREVVSLEDKLC